jgi:oligoribonuclease
MKSLQSKDNLIWIDLEMTGLNPDKERIIEIATLITDSQLNVLAEGPNLIVNQPKSLLDQMDDWNQNQHGSSGLIEGVKKSNITEQMAEIETLNFISKYVGSKQSPMCGQYCFT